MRNTIPHLIWMYCLATSCTQEKEHQITLAKDKRSIIFTLSANLNLKHSSQLAYWNDSVNNKEMFYLLNESNSIINAFESNEYTIINYKKYDYKFLFPNTQTIPAGFTFLSKDSLLFLSGQNNEFCISNASLKPCVRWRVKQSIHPFNIYLYTAFQPLYYKNGFIYSLLDPSIGNVIVDEEKINQVYKVPNGAATKLYDTSFLKNDIGKYPSLFSSKHSYNTTNSTYCVSSAGDAVFSFGDFPELYMYHSDGSVSKAEARSRYHQPPQEFPFEKYTDYRYLREYKLRNSEYGNIFYDPYRHVYLRVYEHGTVGRLGATPIDDFSKKPWSLMILDDDLDVLNEIKFSYAYNPKSILVTRRGILISPTRPGLVSYRPKHISFQLFVYKQAEQP